ncbi:methicillin resistance protein [Solitalea longa]|uniref:Methicillin resistance protein n=2 Tax=Solitalea longa TaxID=2079460 RepID=A0A2S5A010_9SPHI|nr:methicillin resistance protein [Solitalea longa]
MSVKDKYKALTDTEPSICIYALPWWLDAVCGEQNWDVRIIESDKKVVASWAFYRENKMGFNLIHMPTFTPFGGVWLNYPTDQNYTNRLSYEISMTTDLLEQMPAFDYLRQGFSYQFRNWLGFYWNGFKQTSRYSYVLEDLSDINEVFNRFHKSKRSNIRKAEKAVKVHHGLTANEFYEFHKKSLTGSGKQISYSFSQFERLHNAAIVNNAGKVFYAIDEQGNIHSALFVVWDKQSAYSIISAVNPTYNESYSLSLLFYEAIKYTSAFVNKFDFEGSMIKGVETAYRNFGAKQKEYFIISKTPSKLLKLIMFFKDEFLR